jgi:hypothetical protein
VKTMLLTALAMAIAPPVAAVEVQPDDPVLRALIHGDAAQAAADGDALIDTVQELSALGAHPAEGQEDLAALWTAQADATGATPAIPYRGRALGPAYRRGSLAAGARVTLRQLFLAGQRARISVAPSAAAKLSIRVQGADGATLCAKPVGAGQVDCVWLPLFTDRYAIVIENDGPAAAGFYLTMR